MKDIHNALDFILFLTIVGFIMVIFMAHSNMSENAYSVDRLFSSWKRNMIGSLTESSEAENCLKNNLSPLVSYEWPGTSNGCDCTGVRKYNKNIYSGYCSSNKTDAGCEEIKSQSSKVLNNWRDILLCYKSYSKSYFESIKVTSEEDCPTSYKKCEGVLDTLGNQLCVEEGEACPLNTVSLIKLIPHSLSARNVTNDSNVIVSEIRINDEATTCNNPANEKLIDKYELLVNKGGYGCKGKNVDTRFHLIDTYSKKTFYRENNLFDILSELPKYPKLNDGEAVYLHAGTYVGWDVKKCPIKNHLKLEDDIRNTLNSYNSSNNYLIFLVVLYVAIFFIGIFSFKFHNENANVDKTLVYVVYGSIILISLLLGNISRNTIDNIIVSKKQSTFLEFVMSKDCSDAHTNQGLKDLGSAFFSNIDRFSNFNLLSNVSIGASIFAIVIFYITNLNRVSVHNFVPVENSNNSERRHVD